MGKKKTSPLFLLFQLQQNNPIVIYKAKLKYLLVLQMGQYSE